MAGEGWGGGGRGSRIFQGERMGSVVISRVLRREKNTDCQWTANEGKRGGGGKGGAGVGYKKKNITEPYERLGKFSRDTTKILQSQPTPPSPHKR